VPGDVTRALDTNAGTSGLVGLHAEPEHETMFDDFSPGRVHDLVVVGSVNGRSALLGVEGKADETFGSKYVSEALAAAPDSSDVPKRVEGLVRAVFGRPLPEPSTIRYQLLYATAGTVVEAALRECSEAIFLVHVFRTARTTDANHARNDRDLDVFVSLLLGGGELELTSGEVVGPFGILGSAGVPATDRLFVGKVVTDLRDRKP
jgi:hypothetical protein